MSFADEIRSQARSKEVIESEAVSHAKAQEEKKRQQTQESTILAFGELAAAVKEHISKEAKSGAFTLVGDNMFIQGTFEYSEHTDFDGLKKFKQACCIESTFERGKSRGGVFRARQELHKSQFKARYPELFISAFHDMVDGLRQDGIEVSFVYSVRYWCKNTFYFGESPKGKLFQFPLEQLSAGCQIEDWFYNGNGFYWDMSNSISCTYKFRF